MSPETCAAASGFACVLGISLSVINAWLTVLSLVVSIAAGVLSLWLAIRRHKRES